MRGGVRLDRAITIDAPPPVAFAWLGQLRVAPYSYDLLDNLGRRSPRVRDPAMADLATGQRFVRIFGRFDIFELDSFAVDEQITLRPRFAGPRIPAVATTYAVTPRGAGSRLHVRVRYDGPWPGGQLLDLVNLLMMRKQLLTLKALAEQEHARARSSAVRDV